MTRISVKGGEKLDEHLAKLARQMASGTVAVGFLQGATYPVKEGSARSLPVAAVAFWNNFGSSRAKKRPFFSDMIEEQKPTWGAKVAAAAKQTNFNSKQILSLVGTDIKDALVRKIDEWPADNAPSTVARKGFNKGLIETSVMKRSVDFEIKE